MATYNLHKWSVTSQEDPYLPPELATKHLVGLRDDDTRPVRTSSISKIEGNKITTESGSVYILQDIDENYLAWMNDNNIKFDPNNPIRWVSKRSK